jgi:hypothetical protein
MPSIEHRPDDAPVTHSIAPSPMFRIKPHTLRDQELECEGAERQSWRVSDG